MARRRRRLLARVAARPQRGRRTLLRHTPDGATHELTPAPFNVGNRVHEYGGGSYVVDRRPRRRLVDRRRPAVAARPGRAAEPVALTPPDGGRFARPAVRPRARPPVRRARDARRRRAATAPTSSSTSSSRSRSTGPTAPGRVLVAGPDFVAAPRPSPDGPTLAWLEWDHPDMPWDATRLRVADVRRRRRRSARRGRSPAARASRSSSPPGARRASCTSSRTRPAGGTCTRSTAPAASTARRGTSRRWRRSSATPPGSSARSLVRVHSTTAGSSPSRRADGRDALLRIEPGGTVPSDSWTRRSREVEGLQVAAGTRGR